MTQFMLAVYSADEPRPPMTDEEMQQGFDAIASIENEMRAADALVYSGRLLEAGAAKVVRSRRRGGRTTDGPFAETKEHIGGFYIIDALDFDTAMLWASKVTDAIDTPIEVRPFMDVPGR